MNHQGHNISELIDSVTTLKFIGLLLDFAQSAVRIKVLWVHQCQWVYLCHLDQVGERFLIGLARALHKIARQKKYILATLGEFR